MRRTRHRVFIHARPRREKARHEIELRPRRPRRHDYPAHRHLAQRRVVRRQRAHHLLGIHFHQVIERVLTHELRSGDSQGGQQLGRRLAHGRDDLRREIQLDPLPPPLRRQQPAARVEARLAPLGQVAVLPQHVRAGQRGVAAKLHLHRRREPAQIVPILPGNQERRLRQIHLARYVAHPPFRRHLAQHAHRRRIPRKRTIGESVHLDYSYSHNLVRLAHFRN